MDLTTTQPEGTIVTFYAFKGGVGRSMALANVANWLRLQNLKVLIVDWDLEAPGLETFFVKSEQKRERLRSQQGLLDLIYAYKQRYQALDGLRHVPGDQPSVAGAVTGHVSLEQERAAANLSPELREGFNSLKALVSKLSDQAIGDEPHTSPVDEPSSLEQRIAALEQTLPPLPELVTPLELEKQRTTAGPPIHIFTAGVRDAQHAAKYAQDVQALDWSQFYKDYDGAAFFAWFRRQAVKHFDFTLIDSRTGMTEVGGVCTRELADLVMTFCAPTDQNLNGCEIALRSFYRPEIAAMRGGRALRAALVPARCDIGEKVALQGFEGRFISLLKKLREELHAAEWQGLDPARMWKMRITYVPAYAYDETLCVGAIDGLDKMEEEYAELGRFLVSAYFETLTPSARLVFAARSDELRRLAGQAATVHDRMERAFASLPEDTKDMARELLPRLVGFTDPGNPTSLAATSRPLSRFTEAERVHLRALADAGIIRIAKPGADGGAAGSEAPADAEEHVYLSDPKALEEWTRMRDWIKIDRAFLFWRHTLNAAQAEYERSGNDRRNLLTGSALNEAKRQSRERPRSLDVRQHEYIRRSSTEAKKALVRKGVVALVIVAIPLVWGIYSGIRENARKAADRQIQEAKQFIDTAQREKALALLTSAIERDPSASDAYLLRGKLYLESTVPERAYADAATALKLRRDDGAALRLKAQAAFRLGRSDEALKDYEGALRQFKDDPTIWYERGTVYQSKRDFRSAIADYSAAIDLKDDYWDAYFNLALSRLELGERGEAVEVLQKIRTAPDADPALAASATAKLTELGIDVHNMPKPAPVKKRLFVHFLNPADRELVSELKAVLPSVQGIELVSRPTTGDVRYFFPQDREFALSVKKLAEDFLRHKKGKQLELTVLALDGKTFPKVQPGTVELWLPALSDPDSATPATPIARPPPQSVPSERR